MTLIDSAAAFDKRCDELRDGLKDLFHIASITTYSELAFAIGTPQTPVPDAEMQRFTDNLHGGPATVGDCAVVKRLHFESITLVMADLRSQVSTGDVSEPARKLPYVEKVRRLNAQQTRITGLSHRNEQQPSHSLIDMCFQMIESGSLLYVPPSKCTSREVEILSDSKAKQKQVVTLEQGALKASSSSELPLADVGTELKLMFAFQRRGLAFDLVGLLTWSVHVEWTNKLYRALTADVAAGFNPVSLTQLIRADKELFLIISTEYQGPLKAEVPADPPLDDLVKQLMLDPRINIHLTPTARVDKRSSTDKVNDADPRPPKNPKKGDPKAKSTPSLPDALKGLGTKTKDGKPICWHYNLEKGCSNNIKKGRCRFGFHQCMKCGKKEHGASTCSH